MFYTTSHAVTALLLCIQQPILVCVHYMKQIANREAVQKAVDALFVVCARIYKARYTRKIDIATKIACCVIY